MLSEENSLVIVIDIQERLVASLEKDDVVKNAAKIVKASNLLNIPVLLTEQYPKGLGETVGKINEVLGKNYTKMEKTAFNAFSEENIAEKIKEYNKKQIVIMGIETHICVYQTAMALKAAGYDVYVIKDACASCKKYEFKQGIDAMRDNGIKISCVEIVLFEWLRSSKHPMFKEVQALIK